MTESDLILKLTDALQETRQLVAHAYELDSNFADDHELTTWAVLDGAREALEVGEDYRERGPEALPRRGSRRWSRIPARP